MRGPQRLIAMDSGLRECGLSVRLLATNEVLAAALVRSPERELQANPGWSAMALAVVEWLRTTFPEAGPEEDGTPWAWFLAENPRLHEDWKKTALEARLDPNTLLQACGASAAVGAALAALRLVPPRYQRGVDMDVWTQGRNKYHRQRLARGLPPKNAPLEWGELPAAQRAVIPELAKTNLHHVLDAWDMGEWFRTWWQQARVRGTELALPERAKKKAAQRAAKRALQTLPGLKPAFAVPLVRRAGAAAPEVTEGQKPYGQRLRERGLLPKPRARKGRA